MAVPISNVTRRAVYAPSGAGGAGPYAFTFEILANTDIAVFKDDVLLTLTTHYTVTINANGTGSVTITAAGLALSPVSPTQYAIVGNRTISRATDFTTGGDFFANTLNDELDQQTIFAQQNAEGLTRALTAPQTDPTTIDMTLPRAADRANKTLAFDVNGDPTLGISAADVANALTYATNAANSATAAASSASSASSSASSATSSASTATTQASNASTSASNASTSASNASTSASGASTSATNAAASASTASTQASNASTSATNAASSASAASTSASNAATSETNAAASASTASTQASNASTSASNASTSATNAASSAAAAASALDSFDDRYLGTKTSDPTLDNDGNALVSGALYFSTTSNVMKVYDGASWITATSAGATSLLRFRYVATSGQTTFSGADAASATLTYTVNNIAVHRNGVTLDTSEYTASNGTSIVLTVAAGTGDIIDIIAFKSFTVADALSAVSGGTVNGAVTITGVTTVQAGTAAAPAITTAGDTNTGIFFPAADTIAFAEGGAEAMRIDSSGNLGIGTTSPSTYSILTAYGSSASGFAGVTAINGAGSSGFGGIQMGSDGTYVKAAIALKRETANGAGSIVFYNDSNSDAANWASTDEKMRIDINGNVGIGTSSPNAKLQVSSSTDFGAVLKVSDTSSESTGFVVLGNGNSTDKAVGIWRGAANSVSSSGTFLNLGGYGGMAFSTGAALLGSQTERMRIDSSGNVLIGTTAINTISPRLTILGMTAGNQWSCGPTSGNDSFFIYNQSSVGVYLGYGNTSWSSSSDERIKTAIIPFENALEKVCTLRAGTGRYLTDEETVSRSFLIAQDVQAVLPEAVNVLDDEIGTLGLQYTDVIPLLVAAIKEQQALITALTARITALENT
jgi:hypothetical protein